MRNWMKLWSAGIFITLGCCASLSQGVTNVALVTQFALTGVRQASESVSLPVRITNKDILAALNATGRFNFGANAQLLLLSFEDQLPTFSVRDRNGTNVTTTDISAYLSLAEPREVDTADMMTSYAFQIFTFDNRNGTSFSVSGMTILQRGKITGPGIGPLDRVRTLSSSVNGAGHLGGATIVVRGTVHGGSARAEVD